MGCACNPSSNEPTVNLQQEGKTDQGPDDVNVGPAKTGNFALAVIFFINLNRILVIQRMIQM